MDKVTSENRARLVHEVLAYCFYTDEEIATNKNGNPEGMVIADGISHKVGLNPERLRERKEDIRALLTGLPEGFYQASGGGQSFLNLCVDSSGVQWGEHSSVDELCMLAIAAKMGGWCLPCDMWAMFPGGMPYVVFDIT